MNGVFIRTSSGVLKNGVFTWTWCS